MRIVEFLYDTNIPREQLGNYSFKNFTGAMLIREWNDNILGGVSYENGKPVAGLMEIGDIIDGKKQPIKKAKNGRFYDCFITSSCYSGNTYSYGVTYYWTICTTGLACIWNFSFDQDQVPDETAGYGDSGGSPINGTGEVITYFKRLSVHPSPCDGFNQALAAQAAEGKEMNGFITTEGNIIVMPNDRNNAHEVHYTMDEITTDIFGRPLINIHKENNGVWNAIIYYYQGPNTNSHSQVSYDIKAMFHTHPIESGYEWDNPSDIDKQNAGQYSEIAHYIVHTNSIIKFNASGETNRKNSWRNDCGGTSNFVN